MAMFAGTSQTKGSETGMSGRVWAALVAYIPGLGTSTQAQTLGMRQLCDAIATGVIAEIQANATVLVKATDAGLQRDSTAGNPATFAPVGTATLPGGAVQ